MVLRASSDSQAVMLTTVATDTTGMSLTNIRNLSHPGRIKK